MIEYLDEIEIETTYRRDDLRGGLVVSGKEYAYICNITDSTLMRLPNICPPKLSPPESMSSIKAWKFETGEKGLLFSGFDSNIGKCIKE